MATLGVRVGAVSVAMLVTLMVAVGAAAMDRVSAERIQRFRGYTVYSLGHAFAGQRLTATLFDLVPPAYGSPSRRVPRATSPEFAFAYGTCAPPHGEGGCSPPIQVQNYAICARNPHSYARRPRLISLRGAPAARLADHLEVYTGSTTIAIFAHGRRYEAVVRALRGVNARVEAGTRLAPPVRGALEGRLRCGP